KGIENPLVEDDEIATKLDRIYRYRRMHESSKRRAMADLRQLQTEQLWRGEFGVETPGLSILADASKVDLKVQTFKSVQERANLDVLRQHIEAFISPNAKMEHNAQR